MSNTFLLPDLGEGLTEADIVRWLVAEGDTVAVDQPMVEVETAKALVEVPSPYAGTVLTLHGAEGETMDVDVEVSGSLFAKDEQAKAGPSTSRSALKLDDGFQWSAKQRDEDVEMESSEEESEDEDPAPAKSAVQPTPSPATAPAVATTSQPSKAAAQAHSESDSDEDDSEAYETGSDAASEPPAKDAGSRS